MPFITVAHEGAPAVEIHYDDVSLVDNAKPVVFIHGFPLDGRSWERQTAAVVRAGRRAIAHDRRGFGLSDQPVTGYDYDTFAADLHALIEHLDLHEVVLVGFSMGTGDVVRYLSTYGSNRVSKAVLIATIPPTMVRSAANPTGFEPAVFAEIGAAIDADRFAYLTGYLSDFYRLDLVADRVGPEVIAADFATGAAASAWATRASVDTWTTDFTADLGRIDVPVLVLHGTDDANIPIGITAERIGEYVRDLRFVPVEGGPHNIPWTHADVVNRELLAFIGES